MHSQCASRLAYLGAVAAARAASARSSRISGVGRCAQARNFSMAAQVSLDGLGLANRPDLCHPDGGIGSRPPAARAPPGDLFARPARGTRFGREEQLLLQWQVQSRHRAAAGGGDSCRRCVGMANVDGATLAPIAVVKSADLVGLRHHYAPSVAGNALARCHRRGRQRAADDGVAAPLLPAAAGDGISIAHENRVVGERAPRRTSAARVCATVYPPPSCSTRPIRRWSGTHARYSRTWRRWCCGRQKKKPPPGPAPRPIMRGATRAPRRHRRPTCSDAREVTRVDSARGWNRRLLRRVWAASTLAYYSSENEAQGRAAERADARVVATRRQRWFGHHRLPLVRRRLARRTAPPMLRRRFGASATK